MISLTHVLNNWWPVWKVEIIWPPNHTVTDQQKLYKMVYNSEFDNLTVDSNCATCIKRQSSKWIEGEYNYGWDVRDCWAWLFSCSILRLKCFECFRYNKLVMLLHPRLDEFIAVILRVTDSVEIHTIQATITLLKSSQLVWSIGMDWGSGNAEIVGFVSSKPGPNDTRFVSSWPAMITPSM